LGTYALQQLSAFTANLTVNLEPIYGIVLGALIFHENQDLNVWFYCGAAIILGAIFTQAYLSSKKN
jgi:drug/metabolite transporter (DMT)-like permease